MAHQKVESNKHNSGGFKVFEARKEEKKKERKERLNSFFKVGTICFKAV
jgi:hypothetical protein